MGGDRALHHQALLHTRARCACGTQSAGRVCQPAMESRTRKRGTSQLCAWRPRNRSSTSSSSSGAAVVVIGLSSPAVVWPLRRAASTEGLVVFPQPSLKKLTYVHSYANISGVKQPTGPNGYRVNERDFSQGSAMSGQGHRAGPMQSLRQVASSNEAPRSWPCEVKGPERGLANRRLAGRACVRHSIACMPELASHRTAAT